ncbi:hypothetical protein [Streptomyces zagrosensis]|uniref:Uncharacterized protein n=1 Tax=Streptomyces zagrosensis TaxID=1042984 RepID=A0A7W9QH51_9ACTN|nr:hypothetical protein [Streptomyces zagrosensis]MBB5940196.1 hypothetical protein [Streptomyces zagrosensis]
MYSLAAVVREEDQRKGPAYHFQDLHVQVEQVVDSGGRHLGTQSAAA